MATFALLQGDDGSISALSYDWRVQVDLPASVLVAMNIADESLPRFDWNEHSDRIAQMLRWLLADKGYEVVDTESRRFDGLVRRLTQPGPPITSQLTFTADPI